MKHVFVFCALFVCYYVFSGMNSPFFIIGGAISAAIAVVVAHRSAFFEFLPLPNWRFLGYCWWLVAEIVKSSLQVLRQIWTKNGAVEAQFVTIKFMSSQPNLYDAEVAVLGNSITLTPGTVTVQTSSDKREILVHSLTAAGAKDLQNGAMVGRVKRIWGQ